METEALLTYINRNCPAVREFLSQEEQSSAESLIDRVMDTANPQLTAGRLDDLFGSVQTRGLPARILASPEDRGAFLAAVGGSRFLFSVMVRHPELLESMFLRRGYLIRKSRDDKTEELRARTSGIVEAAEFDRMLRRYKDDEYLRIGCRDLGGQADVVEVMEELSDLAAASIAAAVNFHHHRLSQRYGTPEGISDRTGFVVLGMGKISGRELNFSSDVDLIYLREPEEGRTSGPESITVVRFYEALAQSVSRSLSEVTEDGFVFRVDLRLRPEGEKGELVPSVENALDYYLGWGRTWERSALMKAVPLAGDPETAAAFLEELEPFIYRKHLDYSTLEDMRVMKLRIETQLKKKPGINIKLGHGGIREIEFFVQTLQLINAGKTRRVRTPGTLSGLALLRDAGLVEAKTAEDLRAAYLFFRKTEHYIQINHQLQTHELPRTVEEQLELARRLGYRENSLAAFLADLDHHRKVVEELFSGMLRPTTEDFGMQTSPVTRRILEAIQDPAATIDVLNEYGLSDAADLYPILRGLVQPSEGKVPSDRARRLLERLVPMFIEEIIRLPEPGNALRALDSYIDSLHAHSAFFSTLLENPPTVSFLVRILGESRLFTDLLIRHPQTIDSLIARWGDDFPDSREMQEARLAERLAYFEDYESELDALRTFKNEELLRIGVKHFSGEIDSPLARDLITRLAEVCLSASVQIAVKAMGKKYGAGDLFDELPFVILGMGKLGGREMTYLSDVDVIFIYDCPEEHIGRFSAHEWFTRLANRIISILSAPTAEGTVFAMDTRLRPSGEKGPLVSSLAAFRDYHGTTSKLWEKQALTRARPVTGPRSLRDQADKIVKDCIRRTKLTADDLHEIDRLRKRMENEIALEDELHVDLKTGHGGLVDVEFLTQAHILLHAGSMPEVLVQNTLEALSALHTAGLMDRETFGTLDGGYRFLSNLEDRVRIMEQRSVNRMPLTGEKVQGLSRRLGYGDQGEPRFLEDYFRITRSIRAIYDRFFHQGPDRQALPRN